MFENYNIEVASIFKEAEYQRSLFNHEFIGTEHLLLALLKNDSLAHSLLKFGLNYDAFYEEVKNTIPKQDKNITSNIYTPLLKRIIIACDENKITPENILYHLLDIGEGVAIRILINMEVDVDAIYNYLKNIDTIPTNLEVFKIGKLLNESISLEEKVIGRDKEISLIIETLLRKKKNNPLLIGDAGVGKSAIIEELTRMIVKGNVPDCLLNAKIVMLEMGTLVAGTRYRGEFEEKLINIINEVEQNPNIYLFIDEIHTLVNAGAAEGAIAAGDILKPYLARSNIKCIGATTKEEYEKFILKDKALTRRFETIYINEPNEEETVNILKSIKNEYTSFHKINIKDETITCLVHLSGIYFPNRKNPDKSLELLDSVMAYVKLKAKNNLIKNKELELKKIAMLKYQELEKGNYKQALNNNIKEKKLKKQLINLKNNLSIFVKEEDIIDVLEYKNNIIINKKRINIINQLNSKYQKSIIDLIRKTIIKKQGLTTFMFINQPSNLINDLSNLLNYQLINVVDDKSIDKMINKIKYYPSSIIVVNDDVSSNVKNTVKNITKDHILEYNNEYINFNNAIVIILAKEKNMGFTNNFISDYPIDEIINFKKDALKV